MEEKTTEMILIDALQELYFNSKVDIGKRQITEASEVDCSQISCTQCIMSDLDCEHPYTDQLLKIALANWYLNHLKETPTT